MRKRHYLKIAFVGGQLITGRRKPAIQDSEGWIGYKGHNMYRFRTDDLDDIKAFLQSKAEDYMNEFNVSSLAQEIISDLLDEGMIEYGGYGYKAKQKNTHSI